MVMRNAWVVVNGIYSTQKNHKSIGPREVAFTT